MTKDELIAAIQAEIGSVPSVAMTEDRASGPSLNLRDVVERALVLRARRDRFAGRFCIWLYAGSVDQQIDDPSVPPTIAELKRSGLDWDQLVAAKRIASTQKTSVLEMAAATAAALHQQTGMYLVSLAPTRDQSDSPGLVVYPTAADNESMDWYLLLSQLAELSQAIIMVASLGENFLAELQYLRASGAYRRALLLLNGNLVYGPGGALKAAWPLSEIGKAVESVAAETLDPPWYLRRGGT